MSEVDLKTDSLDNTPTIMDSVIQDESEDEVFFGKVSPKEKYVKNSRFIVKPSYTTSDSDRRRSFEVPQAGYKTGSRELYSLQDSLGSRSLSPAEDQSVADKDDVNISFVSTSTVQADDEMAENDVDDDQIPYSGQKEFLSHSEMNENIRFPPNHLTQPDECGDFNENYLDDHGVGATVENDFFLSIPAMEPNKVYEFELEPMNHEAPLSDLNQNHPNSDHHSVSRPVSPQLDVENTEIVNNQECPVTTQNEQRRESKQRKSPYKCDICGFIATKRFLLARHVKTHFIDTKFQFKCHLCDKAFYCQSSLKNHSWKHTGVKLHACTLCGSKLVSANLLKRHIKYQHTQEKNFKCTQCNYASVEKGKVKRHMLICHTGERPHQCKDCSKAFPTFFNLKRHIRTHTMEKPYKCDICSSSFAQLNTMKGHRKIHMKDKPVFHCDICSLTFGGKRALRDHYKHVHTSDTSVSCERCGKVFKDMYSLKCHKKEHKRFYCSLCSFSCMFLNNMKKHSSTHTSFKPLKCDLCHKYFEDKIRLKNHQILAHTEIKPLKKQKYKRIKSKVECQHCDKSFSSEGNLQRHLRAVKMATDSDNEALKRETAMKLDKVIDEMLERKTDVDIQDGDQVLSSDTDDIKLVEGLKVTNGVIEFNFDSDDDSSEEVSAQAEIDSKSKEKIKVDIETCFGFNESWSSPCCEMCLLPNCQCVPRVPEYTSEPQKLNKAKDQEEEEEKEEYEVEKIVAKRFRKERPEYKVKWKNCPESTNTWEPVNNLNSHDLLDDYENNLKNGEKKTTICPYSDVKRKAVSVESANKFSKVQDTRPRGFKAASVESANKSPKVQDTRPRGFKAVSVESANKSSKVQDTRPRGFQRGLCAEKIVAATDDPGQLHFLVRWRGSEMMDLIPAQELNDKLPQLVIRFYEERLSLTKD